jgi:hypothetical protein
MDASLLRDYSFEAQAEEPFAPPYLAEFRKEDKRLIYAASAHDLTPDSPTFKNVAEGFRRLEPACVVIEGLAAKRGFSPPWFTAYAARHAAEGFVGEGEAGYAAHVAAQRGIPYIGGEPSDEEIHAAMAVKGYSTKDVMAFELLRFIPVWRQRGRLERERAAFGRQADAFLADPAWFDIPAEGRLTFQEFERWYERHGELRKPYLDVEGQEFSPLPGGNWFERLSCEINRVRDASAVRVIGEALASHRRVLAVYGGAHLVIGRPAFEAELGPSRDDKPF